VGANRRSPPAFRRGPPGDRAGRRARLRVGGAQRCIVRAVHSDLTVITGARVMLTPGRVRARTWGHLCRRRRGGDADRARAAAAEQQVCGFCTGNPAAVHGLVLVVPARTESHGGDTEGHGGGGVGGGG
jgi:hypothetical protein